MKAPHKVIWNRLDRIIGPMTISVLFGFFGGGLAGYYFTNWFGKPEAFWLGVGLSAFLFVVWPLLERAYDTQFGEA